MATTLPTFGVDSTSIADEYTGWSFDQAPWPDRIARWLQLASAELEPTVTAQGYAYRALTEAAEPVLWGLCQGYLIAYVGLKVAQSTIHGSPPLVESYRLEMKKIASLIANRAPNLSENATVDTVRGGFRGIKDRNKRNRTRATRASRGVRFRRGMKF